MPDRPIPASRFDFRVAIFCAIPHEADAVIANLDHVWHEPHLKPPASSDTNAYTLGRVGHHNIVLVHLPGTGPVEAATAAGVLSQSFSCIELALVVGSCGVAPTSPDQPQPEILLGDVIVSTAVIGADPGKELHGGSSRFDDLEGRLGRPSPGIRAMLKKLQTLYYHQKLIRATHGFVDQALRRDELSKFARPAPDTDRLYQSYHIHKHHDKLGCRVCQGVRPGHGTPCEEAMDLPCDELGCHDSHLIPRDRQLSGTRVPHPYVHYGRVASAAFSLHSAMFRDRLHLRDNVIAFEMEAAGVWDVFPTILIKGACNYADGHKQEAWQPFSALAAAACAKAILGQWHSNRDHHAPGPHSFPPSVEHDSVRLGQLQHIQRLFQTQPPRVEWSDNGRTRDSQNLHARQDTSLDRHAQE